MGALVGLTAGLSIATGTTAHAKNCGWPKVAIRQPSHQIGSHRIDPTTPNETETRLERRLTGDRLSAQQLNACTFRFSRNITENLAWVDLKVARQSECSESGFGRTPVSGFQQTHRVRAGPFH